MFKKKIGKKGAEGLLETIVFLILNMIFFVIMMLFAYNSGTQSFIYEQAYAKQIALLIDNAKPDMVVMVDINELIPIALKKNRAIEKVFVVDEKTNEIKVSLNPTGGYSYKYFSDNSVKFEIKEGNLLITIGKKGVDNEKL
ncbi:hypothetical protein J4218_04325 [Candidatus Pacearchaeota archaeon]|nr:hypothetical protein [Candidatus Pacearchaeota archaeon]